MHCHQGKGWSQLLCTHGSHHTPRAAPDQSAPALQFHTPLVSFVNRDRFHVNYCVFSSISNTQNFTEGAYRVNLVDEHAEVSHIRIVSTKVWVARFHATIVCFLDFFCGCIWHLVVKESRVYVLHICSNLIVSTTTTTTIWSLNLDSKKKQP